jgi:hypothetical protein
MSADKYITMGCIFIAAWKCHSSLLPVWLPTYLMRTSHSRHEFKVTCRGIPALLGATEFRKFADCD